MEWWAAYLAVGAVAGFLAGLLGVGGGLIFVPSLIVLFNLQHFPQTNLLHLALGTSLASITFTSVSSLRAHHAHGAVNWQIVRRTTPGIVVGTLLGSGLAALLTSSILALFFAVFVSLAATQILLDIKPKPSRQLPGRAGTFFVGIIIGILFSLVGGGGAILSVPFMLYCNVKTHDAIGTSSAIGFPIAVSGAAGYILSGMAQKSLPPLSLGFVYLPAVLWLVIASVLTAPLGAKLAHRLPVDKLKKILAVLLYIIAAKMLVGLL
ncbi:MAG TPA: sulfite exporter TauE/SafE family protein [Burkholderiales bacterium]|nr:sulfite exporter TauE/SafE family protein [Burkholderiales bacterium]